MAEGAAVTRTEITKELFAGLTEVQQQVVNAEFVERRSKGLPVPTLEEVKAVHPRKFDPQYAPAPLSPDAIKAAPPPATPAAPAADPAPAPGPGPIQE